MRFFPGICMVFFLVPVINAKAGQRDVADGITILQSFSVAHCLADSYKGSDFARDALAAAGGYFETGTEGAELYFAAEEFVAKWLGEKEYQSKHGSNLAVMKCLDLFSSPELLKVIEKQK